ncbi:MAG: hypothetical protein ACK5SD_17890, partial [Pseudanabaena sp.]
NSYDLSFHLHDDDVLYYNLDCNGESLDGYNSNLQFFENEPLDKKEILREPLITLFLKINLAINLFGQDISSKKN